MLRLVYEFFFHTTTIYCFAIQYVAFKNNVRKKVEEKNKIDKKNGKAHRIRSQVDYKSI